MDNERYEDMPIDEFVAQEEKDFQERWSNEAERHAYLNEVDVLGGYSLNDPKRSMLEFGNMI